MAGINIAGGSSGKIARVNSEGKLETISASLNAPSQVNVNYASSYTITDTITPSPSADFFWMKNESDTPLVLVSSEFWSETEAKLMFYRNPVGTPTGGAEIEPANCNFGSNKKAVGIFYYGSDISGLTNGELRNIVRLQAGISRRFTFDNWTILTRNTSFRAYIENNGGEFDFWWQVFYLSPGFLERL